MEAESGLISSASESRHLETRMDRIEGGMATLLNQSAMLKDQHSQKHINVPKLQKCHSLGITPAGDYSPPRKQGFSARIVGKMGVLAQMH